MAAGKFKLILPRIIGDSSIRQWEAIQVVFRVT